MDGLTDSLVYGLFWWGACNLFVLALDTMYLVLHVLQDRRIVLAKLRSKIIKETKFTKTRRQVLTAEEMLDEHSVCFRILVNLFFERSPVEDWKGNLSFLNY